MYYGITREENIKAKIKVLSDELGRYYADDNISDEELSRLTIDITKKIDDLIDLL